MIEDLKRAKDILKKYNQEHLLNFYDELNDDEKNMLIEQICNIDFDKIFNLYEASKTDEVIPTNLIEPLPYIDKSKLSMDEINFYSNIGSKFISQNKFAVVTMAGGQGTRLGYKGPKGTFELELTPKKSLFEIVCDYLKCANKKYNTTIYWYIMTSIYNDADTQKFFKDKNYFGYDKEHIIFFKQSQLPLIDINGNLILEELYKVKEASNGNGDVFDSMEKHHVIEHMKNNNIEWLFIAGVDNVLLDPTDTLFLGITADSNCKIASKTLLKKDVNNPDWIFARKNGKPAIINSCHLSDEMKIAKDDNGNYLYREMNMLAHLFHISAIEKLSYEKLPYHRAFKKNTYVNEEGMKQVPESPNTFKFETFIFDAFSLFDDIKLLRVKAEDEFSPIKDFNGVHNPEIAKNMYESKFKNR